LRLSNRSEQRAIRGLDLAETKHGGTRSGSWLLHPFIGVGKVRPWLVGWSGPKSKDDGALELRSNGLDTRCQAATESVRGRLAFGKGSSSQNKRRGGSIVWSVERRARTGREAGLPKLVRDNIPTDFLGLGRRESRRVRREHRPRAMTRRSKLVNHSDQAIGERFVFGKRPIGANSPP